MPAIRIWQTTPLTAPLQHLIHTKSRSAECAIATTQNTTPMSGRTPVLSPALHRHPHGATTDHARLPLSGLLSGLTLVQGLTETPLPEQPDPAQSSSPAAVSALGRLPVHLLAYLHVPGSAPPSPARNEPNQAHPPAAPAAPKRKHPEDAQQQLFLILLIVVTRRKPLQVMSR